MNERRIARIEQQIKERIATLLVHEINDPRLGFVTVSRVEVDRELTRALVYWTSLGDETARRLSDTALHHAGGFLRKEVAAILHTRTVPRLEFRYDESVAGALRMQGILDDLRREREDREGSDDPSAAHPSDAPDGESA
ncbi:MAG: 30S ribosome-binding factor RbfA [Planctomycetes bacterium]|nr:30S ribosome-binding factor RbfA [Planctomycetota bacterium]MCB9870954.1 30S ribosome-binding factor RbfA [Planctomycetota bacterium]MCB9888318.1 30S ribosome-binding factor RbfA [Planctomycetota bacterium]